MQVVSACTGSVITMWMIETGQKVKQVRGVLHCILQVLIPRLINQNLTITFSRSRCVQPVSRKLRVTFCQNFYSLRLLFCSCFNCRAPVGSLLCLNNILIGCHGIFISSNLSYVNFFFLLVCQCTWQLRNYHLGSGCYRDQTFHSKCWWYS